MKTNGSSYGSLKLPNRRSREIQLAWDMVEACPALPRFLNFPCVEAPRKAPQRRCPSEKRPLAA